MDKVRLLLSLITIAIFAIPILGMLLAYQDNLPGLVIPSEINEIADDLLGGDGANGSGLKPPTVVGQPQYDEASRTFSVTFQYENTFPIDITIKSLSGNIECVDHGFLLGNASLSDSVNIGAGETAIMTALGTWTEEAIDHFDTSHRGEDLVDVVLVDLALDFSGLQIQIDQRLMEESMQVPNPVS
ncbi:MAG: hypothetical protein JSW44_02990 [Candidatus Bathyarchaeota archaeon]|nr:MAG: hypothetical protein JSW44_02990 [Candidatus Bathyarchaeota archaeon]